MGSTKICRREFVAGSATLAAFGLSRLSASGSIVRARDQAADYELYIQSAPIGHRD